MNVPRAWLALACCLSALAPRPAAATDWFETRGFCAAAQALIADTRLPVRGEVFTDFEAFKKSKPVIRPLTVDEYVTVEQGPGSRPKLISCKFKSADLIRAEYGEQAAGTARSCEFVTGVIVRAVRDDLARQGLRPVRFGGPGEILVDRQEPTWNGPRWLDALGGPGAVVDATGRLHLHSAALRVDWNDWKWRWAPDRFRGTHYCHIPAPAHLQRLLLGEVQPDRPARPGG